MSYIDVHHHWIPKLHYNNLASLVRPGERVEPFVKETGERGFRIIRDGVPVFIPTERYFQLRDQVSDMNRAGVDVSVLSLGLWQEWNDLERCRFLNDELARAIRDYSDRFIGLAHVPIHEGAVDEVERAVKDLGFRGVGFTTHFAGKYPDDAEYLPLYHKINQLNVPIFVHPATLPAENSLLRKYNLYNLGRILDNGLATCRILLSGILDEFPNLKFVMPHLGGAYLMATDYPGARARGFRVKPEHLERIFFDCAPSLRSKGITMGAIEALGVEHVVFGSDYPVQYDLMERGVSLIRSLDLGEQDKRKIMSENAAMLMGLRF